MDLDLFDPIAEPEALRDVITSFHAELTVPDSDHTVSFDLDDSGYLGVKRTLGCVLLNSLSEKALDEALRSLREILVYHTQPVRPEPVTVTVRTKSRIGGNNKRPPLHYSE